MNDLLKKLYEEVVCYEPDVIKKNCHMDDEIKHIINEYAKKSPDLKSEEIQNAFFDVAFLAQKQGFMLGMECAVKLLSELLSE